MSEGKGVKCDSCGCRFVPQAETKTDGDLEYTYFCCPFCGKEYPVSVTDRDLRRGIESYRRLAEKNSRRRLGERGQRRMQQMKTACVQRSRELREIYLGKDNDE